MSAETVTYLTRENTHQLLTEAKQVLAHAGTDLVDGATALKGVTHRLVTHIEELLGLNGEGEDHTLFDVQEAAGDVGEDTQTQDEGTDVSDKTEGTVKKGAGAGSAPPAA